MEKKKITFALYFGNRGFFPGELIADAIKDVKQAVTDCGYDYIMMDESLTRFGAVETIAEGKIFAEFLRENEGRYQGIILSLPNFGDENGATTALKDVKVPVLVQAYPDEIGMMDFAHRRDAFCGKFAMCNMLRQCGIRYTLTDSFVVHPSSLAFHKDIERFAGICRVVDGFKTFNLGAIGARTTAFKTVRVDEIAFANKGINVETIDLAEVFDRMDKVEGEPLRARMEQYRAYADFGSWPDIKVENLARLGIVIDDLIKLYDLQAVAVRCWNELQLRYGIAPCMLLGLLNESGVPAACELDLSNAVMMRALSLASDSPTMLLDLNNNYGTEKDKYILFHCGPVAPSMMKGKGRIEEHLMFKKSYGEGSGVGLYVSDILPGDVTVGSVKTEGGKIHSFATDADLTGDPIEKAFFGCGAVLHKDHIEDMAKYMAENGYRHHLCVTFGHYAASVDEALKKYLGFEQVLL